MNLKTILALFLTWRTLLFVVLFIAIQFLPLQEHFIGGGITNYLHAPYFWAWANFDGEHYLGIAQRGYGYLEHAFFPMLPYSIRFLGNFFGGTLKDYNLAGLLVANVSFILSLIGLYKLVRKDHSREVAYTTLILLLLFPTSFYFGSVYTESLFLAFAVWTFYFARRRKWWLAGVTGFFAASTRFLGILLLPAIFLEFWKEKKKRNFRNALPLLLVPLGLAGFMYFLFTTEGDPLKFIRVLPGYGEQRQITPVILPQVFYRYFFKILPNLNYDYFPIVFTTYLEVLVAVVFLVLTLLVFFKSKVSYAIYSFGLYIVPTLTGSFSSLPRYVLVIFPAFILMAIYVSKISRWKKYAIFLLLFLGLVISTSLFVRAYWVS